MKKIIIILLSNMFICVTSYANPLIDPKTPQTLIDGQSVIVTGSGFGTHPLNVEWLGGTGGNIEKGTIGNSFSKAGWSNSTTNSSFQAVEYSSTRSHRGSKSLKAYTPQVSQYGSGISWDAGSAISKIYVSWWAYLDWAGNTCDGQWKIWRLRPDSSVGDRTGEIMQSDWYNVNGSPMQEYIMYLCDPASYAQCYPGGNASLRWLSNPPIRTGQWQRLELYAEASSSPGTNDGTVVYNVYHLDGVPESIKNDIKDVITRALGVTDQWRYFHFQNYWGNHNSCTDETTQAMFMDDIYIQNGTQARVELCDNSNWQNRKHCEIQPVTSWDDYTIGVSSNKGSFAGGSQAYLYVVDAGGNVTSQGYPVTISSPLAAPTNLHAR